MDNGSSLVLGGGGLLAGLLHFGFGVCTEGVLEVHMTRCRVGIVEARKGAAAGLQALCDGLRLRPRDGR